MNRDLLVTDARHFRVEYEINPYMDRNRQPDRARARSEHRAILDAHRRAGRRVRRLSSVTSCPDMVFTANAAAVRGTRAVLARLPVQRAPETAHHARWLTALGFTVEEAPFDFSGQGDALPCGELLFFGHGWRTDPAMGPVLAERLGYEVVPLRTRSADFYDLDLALGVVDEHTVAWCPDAFTPDSRRRVEQLRLDLVEVTPAEARRFALNLVSDGVTVTMSDGAPGLAATLRARGLEVHTVSTTELAKAGGGVRCTALTLDNPDVAEAVA